MAEYTELSTRCLFCGFSQEFHTNPDGARPQPGDICICYECGYVSAYGEDLQLVALDSEQQNYTETNPKFQDMMAVLRMMKEEDAQEND